MSLLRRFALAVLLALAAPAAAQAPGALNATPERSGGSFGPVPERPAADAGAAEADTTAPWRYFPLGLGDVWEYLGTDGGVHRVVVTGDSVVEGRRYFRLASFQVAAGGTPVFERNRLLRYDTLSALVVEPSVDGERAHQLTPCPLDAAWGSEITSCRRYIAQTFPGEPFAVSGGYDGRLVFGGERPGTGADTVRVAYKIFDSLVLTTTYRFAAGFGLVYWYNDENGTGEALYFARVGGIEHGHERYPGVGTVATEPDLPEHHALPLVVAPNPARDRTTASFALAAPGTVRLDVVDTLGRRVRSHDLGTVGAGRHSAALDLTGLAPGVYVVRLITSSAGMRPAASPSRPITVLR